MLRHFSVFRPNYEPKKVRFAGGASGWGRSTPSASLQPAIVIPAVGALMHLGAVVGHRPRPWDENAQTACGADPRSEVSRSARPIPENASVLRRHRESSRYPLQLALQQAKEESCVHALAGIEPALCVWPSRGEEQVCLRVPVGRGRDPQDAAR